MNAPVVLGELGAGAAPLPARSPSVSLTDQVAGPYCSWPLVVVVVHHLGRRCRFGIPESRFSSWLSDAHACGLTVISAHFPPLRADSGTSAARSVSEDGAGNARSASRYKGEIAVTPEWGGHHE